MEAKDKPAFAAMASSASGIKYKQEGLTKRELIAAMAMQGLLQNEDYTENDLTREACASDAVKLADELLKQLNHE